MTSFKLAFRNVGKSFRDYSIYFLTLTFGVCVFYLFNSLESQEAMLAINAAQHQALRALSQVMGMVSVFISVILGFLILYANRFLVKRRKKELGLYSVLGMNKGQISRVLILETAFVGIFSLAVGLVLGIFLSQGLAVVTSRMFEVPLKSFRFIFSPSALGKAVFNFGLIFLLVMVFNSITVSRQKLIDLLYADRKNERFRVPHLAVSIVVFIFSVLVLTAAYLLIIHNGMLIIDWEFNLSIILGCIGTILFFYSLSGFFLKVLQANRRIYLRGLNMFVLRQINNRINTNFLSMSMVCLLVFVTICTLSAGMGIADGVTSSMEKTTPFDASVSIYLKDSKNGLDLIKRFQEDGVDFGSFAKEYMEYSLYSTDYSISYRNQTLMPDFIKHSDYNRVLKMQGKPLVSLGDDQFAVSSNVEMEEVQTYLRDYFLNSAGISLRGQLLHFKSNALYDTALSTSGVADNFMTIIVPDHALEGQLVSENILNINYIKADQTYDELCKTALQRRDFGEGNGYGYQFSSRINILEQSKSMSTTVAYLAIYIGIVFLITSAALLAIAQLSEASDNVLRYSLLKKIGAEDSMIHRALFIQIGIYFITPLLLAIVHSVIGIKVARNIVEIFGKMDILRSTAYAAGVILLIYGGYFLATYLGSKQIIDVKK